MRSVKTCIDDFKSNYGRFLDVKVLQDAIKEMKKAQTFWGAFDIGSIYTNLNFYRFVDGNEIVGHAGACPNKKTVEYTQGSRTYQTEQERDLDEIYFDKQLAQPYINKVLNGEHTI